VGKVAKVWVMAAVAVAAVGLHFVHPVAGVAATALVSTATLFAAFELNVPATRAGATVAMLAAGAALYLATHSPFLAAIPLLTPLNVPNESVMRSSRNLLDALPPLLMVLMLVLIAAAWPTGWWGLAVAHSVLLQAYVVFLAVGGLSASNSVLRGARKKLALGSTMPELDLPFRETEGHYSLNADRGQFVLLVFVRGDWGRVCHVMMRIISKQAATLAKHNVKLVLISPSEGKVDEEFANHLGLKSDFVHDKASAFAISLGLLESKNKDKDVPLPVAILVDPEGKVRHVSRPDDVTAFSSENKIVQVLEALPAAA
jgi:peroxiredoxin